MYTLKLGNVRVTVKGFQTILVTPQITTHVVVATAIFPRSEQILNIEKESHYYLFFSRIIRKIYPASRIFFNILWTHIVLMPAETVPINASVRPQRCDYVRLQFWVKAWTLL